MTKVEIAELVREQQSLSPGARARARPHPAPSSGWAGRGPLLARLTESGRGQTSHRKLPYVFCDNHRAAQRKATDQRRSSLWSKQGKLTEEVTLRRTFQGGVPASGKDTLSGAEKWEVRLGVGGSI